MKAKKKLNWAHVVSGCKNFRWKYFCKEKKTQITCENWEFKENCDVMKKKNYLTIGWKFLNKTGFWENLKPKFVFEYFWILYK